MLSIKASMPNQEPESGFRRQRLTQGHEYQDIQKLLQKFQAYLIKFDREQTCTHNHPEYLPEYQQKLLSALDKYINAVKKIYAGKSTSFASVLNDALALQHILQRFFSQEDTLMSVSKQSATKASEQAIEARLGHDEKYVYVRIFHRLMPTLVTPKGNFSWIKSLLDSVIHAEKHGFGVYANEADVINSLKDEHYGYITLKINEAQDISAQRPEKKCPIVGCALLTIAEITLQNMLTLTHNGVSYEIKDGVLYR